MKNPIIVLGMHRSGTTLITKLLSEFNIFWGSDLDENFESMFFHTINEWVLRRIGGSWSSPNDIKFLYKSPKLVNKATKILENELKSVRFYQYLGLKNILVKNEILDGNWGWKDPRNILTLPLWLNIFKNPKVIYVKRNGIDIAASLVKRQKEYVESENFNPFIKFTFKQKIKNLLSPIEIYQYNALRCINLLEAYQLWEVYTETAEQIYLDLSVLKFAFKYEDLLSEPYNTLKKMVGFLEVSSNDVEIQNLVSKINFSRKYAFKSHDNLIRFYREHKDDKIMKLLNYDQLL